jgi:hypothetical protein
MAEIENLLEKIIANYPSVEADDFSIKNIDSVLAIQVKGTDVHPIMRQDSSSHKEHIDLTYGLSLDEGFSPVDDFFPTINLPKNIPQTPHLIVKCRVWGESIPSKKQQVWFPSEIDLTRLERNEGANPSLQLRGLSVVRQEIIDGDWLIILHSSGSTQYDVFRLDDKSWKNTNGKAKQLYIRSLGVRTTSVYWDYPDIVSASSSVRIPKPFMLLAGISGTGKTRFISNQAKILSSGAENFCLVPVRPDWHDPSDLMGYVSRIGSDGPSYVVTPLLRFTLAAFKASVASIQGKQVIYKDLTVIPPYWLCLDEMNLAPVEQYFADYLSVLESRTIVEGIYSSLPLFPSINNLNLTQFGLTELQKSLGLDGESDAVLWNYCLNHGIPLPPNLIVAGTVNMDETTHGFSRKVIDRAFTIDFGEFYPTDFSNFFKSKLFNKPITFPLDVSATKSSLSKIAVDPDGEKSIYFLNELNSVLKDTHFELSYRALNELLLAVISFDPIDEITLQAVWDDFVMTKVLPRIEGDIEKLTTADGRNLLEVLIEVLEVQLKLISGGAIRPDLLRSQINGDDLLIECRSLRKIHSMNHRLGLSSFTTFWP